MWAWANSSYTDEERRRLQPVKDFGADAGFMKVVGGDWTADEVEGWAMAAFSAQVLEAVGAYRTPTETGHLYMVIRDASWAN